jgi:hypothetical protein
MNNILAAWIGFALGGISGPRLTGRTWDIGWLCPDFHYLFYRQCRRSFQLRSGKPTPLALNILESLGGVCGI